jgi:penicillin-binding protein 1C
VIQSIFGIIRPLLGAFSFLYQRYTKTTFSALFAALVFCFFLMLDKAYPLPNQPVDSGFAQVVTDKHGKPLRAFADKNGVWRHQVTLSQVSPLYLKALLGYEDRWFYQHPGINPIALARAFWQNAKCNCIVSGGSTLTMQVARRLDPHERSLKGKFKQAFRALQLEWHLSKDEILALYLNYAPMGGVIEGVEAASQQYLNRSADSLSLSEAALLAVLPQAPSRLRPDRYPDKAESARNKVLERLLQQGDISQKEFELAILERVYGNRLSNPQLAPLLARRLYNKHPNTPVIQTTVDGSLQHAVQSMLQDEIRRFPAHHSAAILIIDNQKHSVAAYAGSADFSQTDRFGHVDMINATRSPGSTLKPFIYGLAMEEGIIHSHSLLRDTPRLHKDYQPENFANAFTGPVSTQTALRYSLNLPAVQVLEALTPARFDAALKSVRTPYQLPSGSDANLAMALGGGGFTLWHLTELYSALANNGLVYPHQVVLNEQHTSPRRLFSAETAWVIKELLTNARPDRIRSYSVQQASPVMAWKTGTSWGYRDAWAVGVTPKYTFGVWLGRPDGTPSPGYFGSVTALPLLFRLQERFDRAPIWPSRPKRVRKEVICWPLGLLASQTDTGFCHQAHEAYIIRDMIPPTLKEPSVDGLEPNPMKLRINAKGEQIPLGCQSTDPIKDYSVALWPNSVEPWIPMFRRRAAQIPPTAPECEQAEWAAPPIKINGLAKDQSLLLKGDKIVIELRSSGGLGARDWFLNGQHITSSDADQPVSLTLTQTDNYELVVIDAYNHIDRVVFEVMRNP